jgi:hypothetical protein
MEIKQFAPARPWWLLPPGRVHPLLWGGVGAGWIWIDYLTGPFAQFPNLYVIAVILAAWYSGARPAIAMAAAVPLMHMTFLVAVWAPPADLSIAIPTTMLRGSVITVIGLWFARLSGHERDVHRYVRRLEGLLAICSFCKSIRNNAGDWEPLETFISTRSDTRFTHGLCPGCGKLHYPDIDLESTLADGLDVTS